MGDCLLNGCIMSIHKCLGGIILIAAIGGLKFYATHIKLASVRQMLL